MVEKMKEVGSGKFVLLPNRKWTAFFSPALIGREFFQGLKRVIRYGVWLFVLLLFLFSLFPSIAKGISMDSSGIFQFLPEMFHDIFRFEALNVYSEFSLYFGMSIQFIQMLSCIFSMMLAITCMAPEHEEGTIEFLYSQPVSRFGILCSKFFGRLCSMLVMNLWSMLVAAVMCLIVTPDGYPWAGEFIQIFSAAVLIQLVYFCFAFFWSVIIRDVTVSSSIAFGTFLLTWLFGFLPSLVPQTGFLRYFSPYYLANPVEMVQDGYRMDPLHLIICVAVIAASCAGAYAVFARKEFCRS